MIIIYNINSINTFLPFKHNQPDETCHVICALKDSCKNQPLIIIIYNFVGGKPNAEAKINVKIVKCLLDTGKKISVIEYGITKAESNVNIDNSDLDAQTEVK